MKVLLIVNPLASSVTGRTRAVIQKALSADHRLEVAVTNHRGHATRIAQNAAETVICVSHADPIKAILSSAIGTPLDLFQRIVVGPCSTSVVLYTKERPLVLTLNESHLQ